MKMLVFSSYILKMKSYKNRQVWSILYILTRCTSLFKQRITLSSDNGMVASTIKDCVFSFCFHQKLWKHIKHNYVKDKEEADD